MAFRVRKKKNLNVIRIGVKIIATIIGLYASGIMLTVMGSIMANTSSPFYTGLKLIGWTVGTAATNGSTYNGCDGTSGFPYTTSPTQSCITNTSGTGILAVVGLLAVVWVIFEFVDVSF